MNGEDFDLTDKEDKKLNRPTQHLKGFDWESPYGLYLLAKDYLRFKDYEKAESNLIKSLNLDSTYLPAISEMALLQLHKLNNGLAYNLSQKGLSIDTYDPPANFYYGLASNKLKKRYDAIDAFEVASLSASYRDAANIELAKIYLAEKNHALSLNYVMTVLNDSPKNIESLQLGLLLHRILGKETGFFRERVLAIEPLNHLVAIEEYFLKREVDLRNKFTQQITNELPQEVYLYLAAWYYKLGRTEECKEILSLSPENSEVAYWRAYFSEGKERERLLQKADQSSAHLVFPYLEESAEIMEWALAETHNWKPSYYLALIHLSRSNKEKAKKILNNIQEDIDFAPFYVLKAQLNVDKEEKLKHLQKAQSIASSEWRYSLRLTELLISKRDYKKALQIIETSHKDNPDNYQVGVSYIQCLMLNNHYEKAEEILAKVTILPFEGAIYGRLLFQETKLILSINALLKSEYNKALRKVEDVEQWPRNLGVGKPYDEMIDSSLELWLKARINLKRGNQEKYKLFIEEIKKSTYVNNSISPLIKSIAFKESGEKEKGDKLFEQWMKETSNIRTKQNAQLFYNNGDLIALRSLIKTISDKSDQRMF